MLLQEIFDYDNYKQYLDNWILAQPHGGRGARSALARVAGCQSAYISQILNGNLHFSLEQAQALNPFLSHGTQEAHYFLLLVQKARSGSQELEIYFQKQIDAVLQKRFILRDRLGVSQHLAKEDQELYYSSWLYSAVHVLCDIPEFQTKEAISQRLGFPVQRIADVLEFLVRKGLVQQRGNSFVMGKQSIHLENQSPLISKHHTNWRMRAINSFDQTNEDALHYSSVVTLSRADIAQVKKVLIRAIKDVKSTVRSSKGESLHCFSLDMFELH